MEHETLHHKLDLLLMAVQRLSSQGLLDAQAYGALKQEVHSLRDDVVSNTDAIQSLNALLGAVGSDKEATQRLHETVQRLVVSDAVQEERIRTVAREAAGSAGVKAGAGSGSIAAALTSLIAWFLTKMG